MLDLKQYTSQLIVAQTDEERALIQKTAENHLSSYLDEEDAEVLDKKIQNVFAQISAGVQNLQQLIGKEIIEKV
ncbi:MAG: hypothetical protein MUE85_07885 [Microscillaceae bacterium]|nr:hypothetical protein [Microscillaceae bacterium]